MSGLILVSHNLSRASTLSALYESILSRNGGLWVSWDGKTQALAADMPRPLTFRQGHKFDTLTFPLTRGEREQGYQNYVHQGLWPMFHQRPDLARFSQDDLSQYRKFNEAYARAIAEYAMPDDVIWIQDYHLIPSVRLMRDAGLTNRIGLFFHQPFPAGQGFTAIPDWQWLAESLLCCDLIGFQTSQDMNNFLLWVESAFRCERLGGTLFRIHGHLLRTGVYPVGIDLEDAHCLLASNSCSYMEEQCRATLPQNTILSGGHLDDSAGLPYRISAVEVLLRNHPDYVGNMMLLQLASPLAGYAPRTAGLSHDLESICGEMNGVHGTREWCPVSYLTKSYSREEQAGIYRASRVALVTPLMAGMSLMAKMYVAVQDPANPGVLILSQFAGASEHMDGALIVNPYDPDAIADAIHTALRIPLSERQNRHARLMKGIHRQDCHGWAAGFLADLHESESDEAAVMAGSLVVTAKMVGRLRY
ncbi:Alpha,alpha-trehalose-phosphate synthase [Pantoea sp. AS-PWVM4]|uniref:alpha,alpha-trehalose-phosphate synthase (UDP-forming) n=1 Tax=Pantoea sp. AS-PWVM4 TaxID=1332069 RepID=UPI0003AC618B|nr:trehalose-6-phosphate synthase [Pantoea sp. AS-PWVM4]ERK15164.1 Alpha,alpha-trehalose-phosphate synthase [Pantoea sp. AS-PWVM4]